jgi:phosphoribosylformylglycinamidine synthase
MTSITKAIDSGYIKACHDLCEGGLAVSAAEMAFTGDLGLEIDLRQVPSSPDQWRDDLLLFSESNSRFLVEVEKRHDDAFQSLMRGVPHARIGQVSENPILSIRGLQEKKVVSVELNTLYEAWCRKEGI